MIKIPECFQCEHYNGGKCPAYPDGIPMPILSEKKTENECGNSVRYKRRVGTASQK